MVCLAYIKKKIVCLIDTDMYIYTYIYLGGS